MSIVDERVLEWLDSHETANPAKIKDEAGLPYSKGYVAQRCQELEEKGMIRSLGRGVYMITERGEDYLIGEYDARELDEDSEAGNEAAPA